MRKLFLWASWIPSQLFKLESVEYDLGMDNGEDVKFEGVETKVKHHSNRTCKVLKNGGISSIKFKLFDIPENIQVLIASVQVRHCRETAGGSVNLFVNNSMFMPEYRSAPADILSVQQFLIPPACLQKGENWFKIVLDANSDGNYSISDIAIGYSYIQATDGNRNNTTISKAFRFDFSRKEVRGVEFKNVSTNDYYRENKPYKLFSARGSSSVAITFHLKDNNNSICWLSVILYHCRTNADAIVNLYVNQVPLLLNYSPIPNKNFGFEQFIIPRKLLVTGKNTLTIQLSKDSPRNLLVIKRCHPGGLHCTTGLIRSGRLDASRNSNEICRSR